MNRAQRRRHHAKQRARNQRYRAWEAEHIAILDGLGLPLSARKHMYRLRHLVQPIVWRSPFETVLMKNLYYAEVRNVQAAFVSTAGTEALPRLAELVGGEYVCAPSAPVAEGPQP
jgi:hypothetical protein